MAQKEYQTKEQVLEQAEKILRKSLREIIPEERISEVEAEISRYQNRRKGLLGELVERFVFEVDVNSRPEPDFNIAGIELKTNPLKKH